MCGRFGLSRAQRELAGEFIDLNPRFEVRELRPRYNIAPTQPVAVVRADPDGDAGARSLSMLRWGLIPMAQP